MKRRKSRERGPESPSAPPTAADARPVRRSPPALHYFYLNLAFWGFLILQAVVLQRSLGSGQIVYLFSAILGFGFAGVCVFDWAWLRSQGNDGDSESAED